MGKERVSGSAVCSCLLLALTTFVTLLASMESPARGLQYRSNATAEVCHIFGY